MLSTQCHFFSWKGVVGDNTDKVKGQMRSIPTGRRFANSLPMVRTPQYFAYQCIIVFAHRRILRYLNLANVWRSRSHSSLRTLLRARDPGFTTSLLHVLPSLLRNTSRCNIRCACFFPLSSCRLLLYIMLTNYYYGLMRFVWWLLYNSSVENI